MPSPNLPDFHALWDYSWPDQTETKFCETLMQFPEDDPAFLELLTQTARAQGLQRQFDHAHQTLDQVEEALSRQMALHGELQSVGECLLALEPLERGATFFY